MSPNSDPSVITSKSELVADGLLASYLRPLLRNGMHVDIVYQLLVAATEQRHGFLKIPKSWAKGEGDVREMASAGETFLRVFEGHRYAHLAVSTS